jgi:hypothetical protein
MNCSFCKEEAVYEHRYVAGLYFCEAHKYVHVSLNHLKKKLANRIMVKIGEEEVKENDISNRENMQGM